MLFRQAKQSKDLCVQDSFAFVLDNVEQSIHSFQFVFKFDLLLLTRHSNSTLEEFIFFVIPHSFLCISMFLNGSLNVYCQLLFSLVIKLIFGCESNIYWVKMALVKSASKVTFFHTFSFFLSLSLWIYVRSDLCKTRRIAIKKGRKDIPSMCGCSGVWELFFSRRSVRSGPFSWRR